MVGTNYDIQGSPSDQVPIFYDPATQFGNPAIVLPITSGNTGNAFGVNIDCHVAGSETDTSNNVSPVVWLYDHSTGWDKLTLTTIPTDDAHLTSINNHNEVVGHYTTGTGNIIYAVINPDATPIAYVLYDLNTRILYSRHVRDDAVAWTANSINEKGWIGGSFKPDVNENEYRPILYIPNDVDNNGVSDIREILEGRLETPVDELDENGNWLLDWAENDGTEANQDNIRIGLHAPGNNSDENNNISGRIQHTQIIRIPFDLKRLDQGLDPQYDGNVKNLSVMDLAYVPADNDDCSAARLACGNFYIDILSWIRQEQTNAVATQREMIFTIRNRAFDITTGNYDYYVPPGSDRDEFLDGIRRFGYRWAHCVDYVQFGNETFSGAGEMYFKPSDLMSGYSGGFTDIDRIGSPRNSIIADMT